MKRIRVFAVILSIIFILSAFSSCALYKDDVTKSDTSATTEEGRDLKKIRASYSQEELDTPVITIGERVVTWADFLDLFEEIYTYYYTNYGMDIMENAETLTQYLDLIRESLTKDTIVLYKADELGLSDLTDEQKAQIQANYEEEVDEMYAYYRDYVDVDDTYEDDAARSDAVDKYILDEAEYYCGEGTTIDEYLDYLYKRAEEKYIEDLVFDEVTKAVALSDEDLKEWYDKQVANDADYYTAHPETYKEEQDSFESTGYISDGKTPVAPLYVPDGYGRIYHMFFKSENTVSDKYTENKDKMAELADEYGRLAFDNAANGETEANNDRMEEIMTEYNNLKKENQTELTESYKDAKTRADEAYARLEAGEDFATVMYECTDDSAFAEGGVFAKNGRLISTRYTSQSDWSAEVKREYGKTKKGAYSQVFLDDDGYHIIFHVSNVKSGNRSFESAKREISTMLIETEKQSYYDEQMEAWLAGGTPIEYNHTLIESLTKKISM